MGEIVTDQITKEEIEEATDVLNREGISYLGAATFGTRLLGHMLEAARAKVGDSETLATAAYHHGIRIGMEIIRARERKAREAKGSDNEKG